MSHLLIIGNPIDGLSLLGPFSDADEAGLQAEMSRFDNWCIAEVGTPDSGFASENGQTFLIHGNPVDGLGFIGPFDNAEMVAEFAAVNKFDYWWGAEAQAPADEPLPSP